MHVGYCAESSSHRRRVKLLRIWAFWMILKMLWEHMAVGAIASIWRIIVSAVLLIERSS